MEAIARLAETLPEDRIEQNTGKLPTVVAHDEVQRENLPSGDVARGIETNGCWMVLKNIEQHPDYRRLLEDSLDEVAAHLHGREGGMRKREGFIFLSAPGSVTPSHTDPEHNLLLQVRGTKEMNVGSFPDARSRQLELEGQSHRNIDWLPADAQKFALQPGDGVYVPVHAPHWVVNGESVSVSLSITFQTPESVRTARVHSLNARLRRLGLSPRPPGERPRSDRAKAAVAGGLVRLKRRR